MAEKVWFDFGNGFIVEHHEPNNELMNAFIEGVSVAITNLAGDDHDIRQYNTEEEVEAAVEAAMNESSHVIES